RPNPAPAARGSTRTTDRPPADPSGTLPLEQADELAHPGPVIRPAPDGDDRPGDDHVAVDELSAGAAHLGREVGIAGHRPAPAVAGSEQQERAVAVGRDRLAGLEEVADDGH